MKIKRFLKTSILKTILFNYHYFGLSGLLKPKIMISKKTKFKKLKGKIILKNNSSKIYIGYGYVGLFDDKYNRVIWENNGTIVFDGNAKIGLGSSIVNKGELILGNNFTINSNCNIVCYKKIKFGSDCLISWNTLFMDTDFHSIYNEDHKRINDDKEIIIGNNVWVCCGVTILKGVVIGDNNVLAAGSVVTTSLMDTNSIYASNDVIKKNITWGK